MTPEEQERCRTLRSACKALGKGGQKRMAKLLGISARGLRYKLVGKNRITERDQLAVKEILRSERVTD